MTNDRLDSLIGPRPQLKDLAYEKIRTMLVNVEFAPGDVLREQALVKLLGISKTPIREALIRLQHEGFVESEAYRGFSVRGYTPDDLRDIYEIRELIEAECASRIAAAQDSVVIEQLLTNVAAAEVALARGELDTVRDLIREFDSILFSTIENERLRQLVDEMRLHVQRIGRITTGISGRLEQSVGQHRAIVDAIAAKRSARARQLMSVHIRSVLSDQLRAVAGSHSTR